MTSPDTRWMNRCFDLAVRGIGHVSPNPPVGATLVHEGRILGEGFHTGYGEAHAEVEAVRNVPAHLRHLIPDATLYVSLEPCCVTGKTPPCTDMILREGIRDVKVSTRDPNPDMSGKGLAILREAGVNVTDGISEEEGKRLLRPFTTNILYHRPHVVLKWAQSKYGYTGVEGEQVWLSHPHTRAWTHRQRAEADAVLTGAGTVAMDNPALTVRAFPGRSPHRVVFDPNGRLSDHYSVFNHDGVRVYYFSKENNPKVRADHIIQKRLSGDTDMLQQILRELFADKIGYLLVEGGARLHHMFIEDQLWDEAWVIRTNHPLDTGIAAPSVHGRLIDSVSLGTDTITGIQYTPPMEG